MRTNFNKRILLLIICCLLLSSLSGCKNDKSDPAPAYVPQAEPAEAPEVSTDWEKELQDYLKTATLKATTNAVLHTGQKGSYMELQLQKGATIDVHQKRGYDLIGYENSSGVKYVDADGHVIKEYIGNDRLLLKAVYSTQDFTIQFCKDSGRDTDLNALICAFDKPITATDLHIGKVMGDECIIGLTDKNGNEVLSAGQEIVYIEDFGSCVNYSTRTVDLYVKTAKINFHKERLSTYEVSTEGFLEQSLNTTKEKCDSLSFAEYTDLPTLKALGYENVIIQIETQIRATNGKQLIRILNDWPEEKKELDDVTLFNSGKIDLATKEGDSKEYQVTVTIPIEKISDKIYIAYNAEGLPLANNDWKSNGLALTITFSK